MSLRHQLFRGLTRFDFVGNRRRWFILSGVLLLISALGLGFRGLNLGIDFVGGTGVEAPNEAGASIEDVRSALGEIGQAGAKAQLLGGGDAIRVQTEELTTSELTQLIATVAQVGGVDVSEVSSEDVGPTFGEQVAESALRALIIFLIVVTIFIAIRFEWRMAVAAMAALFHDLLLTAGVYAVTGFEVTPATVVAILTILGYSLYDTVVVFDKIEEHIELEHEKSTITGIVNTSMNQVLMRSINTSLTSLLPVGSLLFVGSFLLGAATLREFALALFVGIAAGTYSSIFFASPILAIWKEREDEWQRMRRRLDRKAAIAATNSGPGTEPEPAAASAAAAVLLEDDEDKPRPAAVTGATPRPPKRRRRKR